MRNWVSEQISISVEMIHVRWLTRDNVVPFLSFHSSLDCLWVPNTMSPKI